MKRRLLFVAYPYLDANMGGVRLRRIARLLPKFEWEVVVLTHTRNDSSVTLADSPGVRVIEVEATDLTSLYRRFRNVPEASSPPGTKLSPAAQKIGLTSEINRWLMIPDKIAPWRGPATRRGAQLLQTETFDAIFASLDPRTSLLVATDLSGRFGIPSVIEYRDLWIGNPYYHITQPTKFHSWLHQRLERKVLRRANRVSAVCQGIAGYLSATYQRELRKPVALNYNFFDPAEYPGRTARPTNRPFVISYTGALYASRTPHQFFEGMRQFIDEQRLAPEQFRFRWAGGAAGINDLAEVIQRTGITPYMDFLGMIPHREALRLMMESDAALLIQAPDDRVHIPGKLFEALGARVPLLALANPCEVTEIMKRCHAGLICGHSAGSVADALQQFATIARSGGNWPFNNPAVETFSADSAVGRLSQLLESAGQ